MSSTTLTTEILQELYPSFQGKKRLDEEVEPSLPTNCPEHIPLPALLPGEELLIKEHRIMCIDAAEEPMIGALYITNYRVIFSGNLLCNTNISMVTEFQDGVKLRKHKKAAQNTKPLVQRKINRKVSTPTPSFNSFLDGSDNVNNLKPRFRFGQQLKQFKDGILERTRTKRTKGDASNNPAKDPSILDSLEIGKPITMKGLAEEESPGHESCESAGSDSLYDLSLETVRHHVIPNPLEDAYKGELDNEQLEPDFEKVPDSLGGDSQISQSDSNASSLVFNQLIVDTDDSNDEVDIDASPTSILNNFDNNLETNLFLSSNKPVPSQRNPSPKVDNDHYQTENPMISSSRSPCLHHAADRRKRKPVTLPRNKSLRLTAATTGEDSDSIDSPLFSSDISRKNRPQTMPRNMYKHVAENGVLASSAKPKIFKEKPPIIPRKSSGTLEDLEDAKPPIPKPRLKKTKKLNSIRKPTLDKEHSEDTVDTVSLLPAVITLNSNKADTPPTRSPGNSPLIERKAYSVGAVRNHQLLRPMSSCSVDARLSPNPSLVSNIAKSVSSEELNDEEKSDLTLAIAPAIEMAPFEGDENFRDRFKEKKRRSKTLKATTRLSEMRSRSQLIEVKDLQFEFSVSLPLECIKNLKRFPSHFLKEHNVPVHEGILVLCKNCHSLKLSIHQHNTYDADHLKKIIEGQLFLDQPLYASFAFKYCSAINRQDVELLGNDLDSLPSIFKLDKELDRLGILECKLWRICELRKTSKTVSTDLDATANVAVKTIATDLEGCPSYPSKVVVPVVISDLDLMRGVEFYREKRFPAACWRHKNGAVLLRGGTATSRRGAQNNPHAQSDEAFIKAVVGCIEHGASGGAKFYIFTEKYEQTKLEHVQTSTETFHGSLGGRLTPKQATRYYYHNCEFVEADSPPSFKNVRHSFTKLQALFENKVSDSEYLSVLDESRWLKYISELLKVSCEVCVALHEERSSVMVCYEAGWDRTTQIVSLAQLMLDPYYRTMEGFQVLIQKEWLWFGHPFASRHSSNRSVRGPVFLQFLDCVWQIQEQCPSAFEMNDKFLETLVDYSYSGLFGTFLVNQESDRHKNLIPYLDDDGLITIDNSTVSFWAWLAMVNATEKTFYNEAYCPELYTGMISPECGVAALSLWTSYYCRFNPKENVSTASNLRQNTSALLQLYKVVLSGNYISL
ncbi:uncharacterized protein [Dysidea avara]|uniref:uncharacterized protein isoform X2 n=1 Tax=Dysidea avara TaxID=196820 RepID=UPI00332BCDF5